MSVTRLIFPYGEAIQWLSPDQTNQLPTSPLTDWLLSNGSLTQKLRSHCVEFEVKILAEDMLAPFNGECLTANQSWVREVLLCLDGIPWIFARTLIPISLFQQQQFNFVNLGTRPLGELLFSSDTFSLGKIEIAHFTPCHKLTQLLAPLEQTPTQELWGRRRYFCHHDEQLIVSEIFLPAARRLIEAM
ncbi:chorismate lyase [Shewanella sp. VB17]|uniref:chorismate--pyruvate lyase family protein n=1 Tax=Shewanella sp. VB17 TaxID=2739432 RepID=UPI001565E241|nr:chorismate lyase [Shewanella sp. VB17]NRD71723.1 chorismate lyase [Shewanella sp. VB17]